MNRIDVLKGTIVKGFGALGGYTASAPVMFCDAARYKASGDLLMRRYSIYIEPINYPTAAIGAGSFALRRGRRTEAQLAEFVEAPVDVWRERVLPFTNARVVPLRRPAPRSAPRFSLD